MFAFNSLERFAFLVSSTSAINAIVIFETFETTIVEICLLMIVEAIMNEAHLGCGGPFLNYVTEIY